MEVTIALSSFIRAFNNELFPTFGFPIKATSIPFFMNLQLLASSNILLKSFLFLEALVINYCELFQLHLHIQDNRY